MISEPQQTVVPTRRDAVKRLAIAACALMPIPGSLAASRSGQEEDTMPVETLALGNRAHFMARPEFREKLTWCFSTVLRCGPPAVLQAPGIKAPILAFRFPGGGSISIELSDNALDEAGARRGAWLEIQTDDVEGVTRRIIEAGLPRLEYAATTTFYFAAPGGQVFGVMDPRARQAELKKPGASPVSSSR